MESRVDTIEKGVEDLWVEFAKIQPKLSKLDHIEEMLETLMRDRGTPPAAGGESGSSVSAAAAPPLATPPDSYVAGRRLEIPSFRGEDPVSWLSRAEQYFRVHHIEKPSRIELALIAMDGAALHWMQWVLGRLPSLTWKQFSAELLRRYGDNPNANPFELLLAATAQIGINLGLFLNGLREDIRVGIRSKDAADLFDTIHLAREIEHELQATRGPRFGSAPTRPPSSTLGPGAPGFRMGLPLAKQSGQASRLPPSQSTVSGRCSSFEGSRAPTNSVASSGSSRPPRGTRQLSRVDYLDLRAKWLCFKCREPYHPLHNCSGKSLRVLIMAEGEEDDPPGDGDPLPPTDVDTTISERRLQQLELSALAAGGFDGPRAMKILATIHNQQVKILIDSGASHCFISDSVVRLGLPIDTSNPMHVRLGDGQRKEILGSCTNIDIVVGPATFQVTCFVFPLGGVDVILGISWLATLGDAKANWAMMTMDFWADGQHVSLRGDQSLVRREISAAGIQKLQDIEQCWVLWAATNLHCISHNLTSFLKHG
ncbi:hypothetical protein DH2020_012579 [Rehmannia glutinosa]|uniref:Retrotransposon gag domain-containing protein n=1 Tax=Rehmannia glutinosa TaxID=99300 RepID=A0ABR0X3M6_REHGL